MLCEFHLNKKVCKPQQKPNPFLTQLWKIPRTTKKDKSRRQKINNDDGSMQSMISRNNRDIKVKKLSKK